MARAAQQLFLLLVIATTACFALTAPELGDLAPRLYSTQLNYRVAVGSKDTPFQMKDLHVELTGQKQLAKKGSTGIHDASLLREPSFVNDRGEQTVDLKNGGWEIVWAKASAHGHLSCSFVNSETVQRNDDATLEAGRFFMYHRVWTKASLESERERRRKIQAEAAKKIDERDQKLKKVTDENENVGSKVLSYAQAAKSMNDYYTSGYKEALFIPLYDDQVLELTPECIVSTRGLIYKIEKGKPEKIGESRVDFLVRKQ